MNIRDKLDVIAVLTVAIVMLSMGYTIGTIRANNKVINTVIPEIQKIMERDINAAFAAGVHTCETKV